MAGQEMTVSANVIREGHIIASEWMVVLNGASLRSIYRAVQSLWSTKSSRDSATEHIGGIADAQVREIFTTLNGALRRKQNLSDSVAGAQIITFHLDKDGRTEDLAYNTHLAKRGLFLTDTWPVGTKLAASIAATLDKDSPGIQRLSVDFPLKGTITESALQKYFANEGKQRQLGPSGQIGETLPPSSLPQPTKKQDPRQFWNEGEQRQPGPSGQIGETLPPSSLPQPTKKQDPSPWANKGNQRQPTSEQIPSTPEQIRAPPEVPHPTLPKPTKSTDSGPSQGGGSGEVLQGLAMLFGLGSLWDTSTCAGEGKARSDQIVWFKLIIFALCMDSLYYLILSQSGLSPLQPIGPAFIVCIACFNKHGVDSPGSKIVIIPLMAALDMVRRMSS